MTPSHLTADQIARFRDQSLTPEELLAVAGHLAGCRECRAQPASQDELDQLGQLQFERLRSRAAHAHLSAEEARGYVHRRLGSLESELVEAHAEHCADCARALDGARLSAGDSAQLSEPQERGAPEDARSRSSAGLRGTVAALAAACVVLCAAVALLSQRLADARGAEQRLRREVAALAGPARGPAAEAPQPLAAAPAVISQAPSHPPVRRSESPSGPLGSPPAPLAPLLAALPSAPRGGPQLLAPVSTAVLERRPLFLWRSAASPPVYTVSIWHGSSASGLAQVGSVPGFHRQWRPQWPLPPGDYRWSVAPSWHVSPTHTALFRVASSAEAARIRHLAREKIHDRLALALLYARAGMLDRADQALRGLVAARPADVEARKMLVELRSWRKGLR